MKYITHLESKLLFAAVVLGVLIISGSDSTRADGVKAKAEPGKMQHLASVEAVPGGLTASNWSSIRAAYLAQHIKRCAWKAVTRHTARSNSGAHNSMVRALLPDP